MLTGSCQALDDSESSRYSHLQSLYGSLEGREVYATLEPFRLGAMRPRSHSCEAQLYHHLQH